MIQMNVNVVILLQIQMTQTTKVFIFNIIFSYFDTLQFYYLISWLFYKL